MPWTVATESTLETPPVKGSRFMATVAPASEMDAALAVVDSVRIRHPRANHHCWAALLANGTSRCSDDGEPGGSAGRPILARIGGREATDVVVVVTRWFGGTKLGVGGLVRAYGGCAGAALDAAVPVEVDRRVTATLHFGYGDTGAVERVMAELNAEEVATDYAAMVVRRVRIAPERRAELGRLLGEATAGRARFEHGD